MYYPAIFEREADGRYAVFFPDLPGCQTYGNDFDHAMTNAVEALSLFVETAEELGAPSLDRGLHIEGLAANQIVAAVPLIRDTSRSVRINISLDKGMLDAIDAVAKQRGQTRSGFLTNAARRELTGG